MPLSQPMLVDQRARQTGVLSPNDVRGEEGWLASSDPTANSIQPAPMGGARQGDHTSDDAKPPPTDTDGEPKKARLNGHAH
jgi:hypothetical protein